MAAKELHKPSWTQKLSESRTRKRWKMAKVSEVACSDIQSFDAKLAAKLYFQIGIWAQQQCCGRPRTNVKTCHWKKRKSGAKKMENDCKARSFRHTEKDYRKVRDLKSVLEPRDASRRSRAHLSIKIAHLLTRLC